MEMSNYTLARKLMAVMSMFSAWADAMAVCPDRGTMRSVTIQHYLHDSPRSITNMSSRCQVWRGARA